jgi:hypothetical protein
MIKSHIGRQKDSKGNDIHQKSSFLFILSGAKKKKKVKVVSNSIQPAAFHSIHFSYHIKGSYITGRAL